MRPVRLAFPAAAAAAAEAGNFGTISASCTRARGERAVVICSALYSFRRSPVAAAAAAVAAELRRELTDVIRPQMPCPSLPQTSAVTSL